MTKTNMKNDLIFEACVGSVSEAIEAERKGAHRIELCKDLENAGLTPCQDDIIQSKKILKIPVFVIIRPTFRDFIYSEDEFEIMKKQISFCKENNIDGVVFGILESNGDSMQIDINRNKELIELAKPMKVTFHMAFDLIGENNENYSEEEKIKKKLYAIDKLIELKFDRILSKGCSINAVIGKDYLKQMNDYAKGKIIILPGGGVNIKNRYELFQYIGCRELHGTKIVGNLN